MSNSVTIIFDPFSISKASGTIVSDAPTEKGAFIQIDTILKGGGSSDSPLVIVVEDQVALTSSPIEPDCVESEALR